MRERSVRQLRPAGVFPRRKPERAHIGCRVGELANQNRRGLIVEAVVILVVEGVLPTAGVAVGGKKGIQPSVRDEACLESAIRGGVVYNCLACAHTYKIRING